MKLKLIETTSALPVPIRGGYQVAVNTAKGGLSCTLSTRYEVMSINDIWTLAHYPRTTVLYKYEI